MVSLVKHFTNLNLIRWTRAFSCKMSESLSKVSDVDIDPKGIFKYILIKVHGEETDGEEVSKMIVRGYKACPFHGDIFDKTSDEQLSPLGLEGECLGGGRINHDPDAKKILVYGYSQGYGKADHEVSVCILKKHFVDYNITWSDDGY